MPKRVQNFQGFRLVTALLLAHTCTVRTSQGKHNARIMEGTVMFGKILGFGVVHEVANGFRKGDGPQLGAGWILDAFIR